MLRGFAAVGRGARAPLLTLDYRDPLCSVRVPVFTGRAATGVADQYFLLQSFSMEPGKGRLVSSTGVPHDPCARVSASSFRCSS